MYPRQNQKNGIKNKDVQKELEAEDKKNASEANIVNSILSTGNENAGKILLEADESSDDLFGSLNEAIKEPDQAPAAEEQKESGAQNNIVNEENNPKEDLGGSLLKEVKKEIKKKAPKEYGKKDPARNLFPGDKPAKPTLYEDPADLQEKMEIVGDEEELYNENLLDLSDNDSMKNMAEKKKHPDSWRLDRTKRKGKTDGDLNNANQTQERIAGLNIAVQKLGKRNKAGRIRRWLSDLAIFAGSTIGAALNWIGAAVKRLCSSDYRKWYNRGQSKATMIPEIDQKKRRHDLIPGWNGETFQKGPNGEDDILADFRRIPTVWSRLTAGQAEDKNGKPLAPKISIYIRQGTEGEDQSVNGTDPGHAGLGIEYSRYSQISKRYERYNLRYGFFPGSQETKGGSLAMTADARIPGQLKSEESVPYSVRRTFTATAKQVNAILKASETYADKGYNSFTRNCTTFVKDMVKDEAGIAAGDTIFEQEAPGFSSLINFALFAGKSSENTARKAMEERFARLGTDKDLNYGGDGNMRVNQQDYQNYKESLANSSGGYVDKADLPNAAAENMRRLEGDEAGQIGSRSYFGTARVNPASVGKSVDASLGNAPVKRPDLNPDNIRNAIVNESNSLIRTILSVTRKRTIGDLNKDPGIDKNVKKILRQIEHYGAPLRLVKGEDNDPVRLRNARSQLDKYVSDLNTLLFDFFKNDNRLHMPIMHMISLLEYGINVVDYAYQDTAIGKDVGGDLRNIRGGMDSHMEIKYKDSQNVSKRARLTPSHYEAYLQIFKSPHKAIEKASRFQALRLNDRRTKAEEEEFQKLKRIDNLAWDYDYSHRYMLEKDSYSQQDVDYTFSLEKLENKEKTDGSMTRSYSSGIYKSLILEKIFGGVVDRLENDLTIEDVENKAKLQKWLETDMTTCLQRRPDEMKTVISAIKKADPELSQEEILQKLLLMIKNNWISKVFNLSRSIRDVKDKNSPMVKTGETVPKAYEKIAKDSAFTKKLAELIQQAFVSHMKGNMLIELD